MHGLILATNTKYIKTEINKAKILELLGETNERAGTDCIQRI